MNDNSPLDQAMNEILGNENPHAYTVFTYIRQRLRQFGLHWRMEPYDVLHEAYRRGCAAIEKGKTIDEPYAWLKRTSFNIVREHHRSWKIERRNLASLYESYADDIQPTDYLSRQEQIQELQRILHVLRQEFSEEFQLLYLKKVRQYSWQEISEKIRNETGEVVNEVMLRQRLSRAKKKFRAILHRLGTT